MAKQSNQHAQWAKIGARARVAELCEELASIYQAFPDLKQSASGTPRGSGSDGVVNEEKRRFSAAGKAAISQGMLEYWARRKALAAKASKKSSK